MDSRPISRNPVGLPTVTICRLFAPISTNRPRIVSNIRANGACTCVVSGLPLDPRVQGFAPSRSTLKSEGAPCHLIGPHTLKCFMQHPAAAATAPSASRKSTGVVRLRESRARHHSAASSAARSEVVSSPKQSEATRLADKRVDRRLTAAAWHGSRVLAQWRPGAGRLARRKSGTAEEGIE
jgi:hypothetical protein